MDDYQYKLKHSAEHIFAQAIKELYGDKVTLAVAHITDSSFANDSKWSIDFSEEMFPEIEKKMKEIINADLLIQEKEVTIDEARNMFANNPYKIEWLEQWAKEGNKLTVYWTGDQYFDLCKGPHVERTSEIKAFKLMSTSGAYWRGDENNDMLKRVYGVAFASKEELDEYLNLLEEAKRRDHRKLGKELGLFTFSDLVGSGLPLFTPKGAFLRQQLASYSEELQRNAGFEQVWIPHITKTDLYKTSGHWDKFGNELFLVKSQETDDQMVLKPMNCPHHTQIYASAKRSYRDLPIRYFETTTNFRDEKAGELSGLSRVRSLTQDDAHVFCRVDQIENEFTLIMGMIKEMYSSLQLEFRARLSFWDPNTQEKYHGDQSTWEEAQRIIEEIAKKLDIDYFVAIGEAAFYGPKIDIMVKDSLGREWQCATEQLDFVQPQRFGLTYVDSDGSEKTPVMIHKALLGSIERFMSVYIEHTAGNFPLWLSYTQVVILPISIDKHGEYAKNLQQMLRNAGLRVEVDDAAETLGNRIRKAQSLKTPYMIVIGDKEMESGELSVRKRDGQSFNMSKLDFINLVKDKVATKSLEL